MLLNKVACEVLFFTQGVLWGIPLDKPPGFHAFNCFVAYLVYVQTTDG